MTATRTKKPRVLDTEMLYDLLLGARTADMVTLLFKDGRVEKGSLVFNQTSLDFLVDELRDVRV
jgi:hypothetical protein